jgi:hypothetical protein
VIGEWTLIVRRAAAAGRPAKMCPMPVEVRIHLFARDQDLATWLTDELALLSPSIEVKTLATLQTLAADPAELWIVELEALSNADDDQLRALVEQRTAPVIAIGAPSPPLANAPFACVLDAKLTSKQLKRAVRDVLASPR